MLWRIIALKLFFLQSDGWAYQRVPNDSSQEDNDVECNEDHLKCVHSHPTPEKQKKQDWLRPGANPI